MRKGKVKRKKERDRCYGKRELIQILIRRQVDGKGRYAILWRLNFGGKSRGLTDRIRGKKEKSLCTQLNFKGNSYIEQVFSSLTGGEK